LALGIKESKDKVGMLREPFKSALYIKFILKVAVSQAWRVDENYILKVF
jgi:hypothetical protein